MFRQAFLLHVRLSLVSTYLWLRLVVVVELCLGSWDWVWGKVGWEFEKSLHNLERKKPLL